MDLQRTLAAFDGTPLTLRDVFASAALIGLITAHATSLWGAPEVAHDAFALADAMLAEREKERGA